MLIGDWSTIFLNSIQESKEENSVQKYVFRLSRGEATEEIDAVRGECTFLRELSRQKEENPRDDRWRRLRQRLHHWSAGEMVWIIF